MSDDFNTQSLAKWDSILRQLFPIALPHTAQWQSKDDILQVLSTIAAPKDGNHLFHPTGGGSDLTGATLSVEADCIELHFGPLTSIVNPTLLSCEVFADSKWTYFRLETEKMTPTDVYEFHSDDQDEEVLETTPGKYSDRSYWDADNLGYDNNGDEIPLPNTARVVSRCTLGGAFVIFCKGSLYNQNTATYDARHNKLTASQFRSHIAEAIFAVSGQAK